MKKGDFIIIIVALMTAGIIYFGYNFFTEESDHRIVKITVDQKVVKTVNLDKDTNIKYLVKTKDGEFIDIKETDDSNIPSDGYDYNLVYIHDNGVQVIDADCPAKVDVKQGFVDISNYPIVCLPHKLSVVIEPSENAPENGGEHDAVV